MAAVLERWTVLDGLVAFGRGIASQEQCFGGAVYAHSPARGAPHFARKRVDFRAQPLAIDTQWQAKTAAYQRVFIQQRMAGEIEHEPSLPAADARCAMRGWNAVIANYPHESAAISFSNADSFRSDRTVVKYFRYIALPKWSVPWQPRLP